MVSRVLIKKSKQETVRVCMSVSAVFSLVEGRLVDVR